MSPLGESGSLYAEFHTGDAATDSGHGQLWSGRPASRELYDGKDEWQMSNLLEHDSRRRPSGSVVFAMERLSIMLKAWVGCAGHTCP
jgi:hypothetical protein